MTRTEIRPVDTKLPDPPYPADTEAGAFSFEIDVNRLVSSDTWDLLPPDVRPWWIMLLIMSWRQVPCGSFKNNFRIIAAKLGTTEQFVKVHQDNLLRGWYLCSDGRLYHSVIAEKVVKFLNVREKWRSHKKQRLNSEFHSESTKIPPGVHPSSAPSSSSSSSSSSKNSVTADAVTSENSDEISRAKTPKGDWTTNRVPFEKIVALWAEVLPELPQPVKLSPARKAKIRARWNDDLPDLDAWRECFQHIRASRFLMGKTQSSNGRQPFRATLDWITKQENLLRLYEGKYDG